MTDEQKLEVTTILDKDHEGEAAEKHQAMQGTKEALSKMVDNEFEQAKETASAVNEMEDILTLDKIKELNQGDFFKNLCHKNSDRRRTSSQDQTIKDLCERATNTNIRRQEIIQHVIETTNSDPALCSSLFIKMLEGWEESITDWKKPFGRLTKSVYVMDTLKQRDFLTTANIALMAKSKEIASFSDTQNARVQKMKTTGTFHMYIAGGMQPIPKEALGTVELEHVYQAGENGPIYATMQNGCKANPIIWMPDSGTTEASTPTPAIEIPATTIVEITAGCDCAIDRNTATSVAGVQVVHNKAFGSSDTDVIHVRYYDANGNAKIVMYGIHKTMVGDSIITLADAQGGSKDIYIRRDASGKMQISDKASAGNTTAVTPVQVTVQPTNPIASVPATTTAISIPASTGTVSGSASTTKSPSGSPVETVASAEVITKETKTIGGASVDLTIYTRGVDKSFSLPGADTRYAIVDTMPRTDKTMGEPKAGISYNGGMLFYTVKKGVMGDFEVSGGTVATTIPATPSADVLQPLPVATSKELPVPDTKPPIPNKQYLS